MAGDGGPGPARSLDGHPDGSAAPSEGPDEQHRSRPPEEPRDAPGAPGETSSELAEGPSESKGRAEVPGEVSSEDRTEEAHTELPGATAVGGGEDWSTPAEEVPSAPEAMRQAAFMGVVLELPSVHPSVVLQEIDAPMRELRVTIAQPEGVAIAYAWRGIATPRPLTHDLLTTILQRFGLQVDAVRITGVNGPVFHAEIALSGPSGSHTVECRPSDALALALRQPLPVPIMVAEEVLATAGRSPGA